MSKGIHGDAVAEGCKVLCMYSVLGERFSKGGCCRCFEYFERRCRQLSNECAELLVCMCILRTASGPSFGGGKDPGTSDTGMV